LEREGGPVSGCLFLFVQTVGENSIQGWQALREKKLTTSSIKPNVVNFTANSKDYITTCNQAHNYSSLRWNFPSVIFIVSGKNDQDGLSPKIA
jgi:hypothetical protein